MTKKPISPRKIGEITRLAGRWCEAPPHAEPDIVVLLSDDVPRLCRDHLALMEENAKNWLTANRASATIAAQAVEAAALRERVARMVRNAWCAGRNATHGFVDHRFPEWADSDQRHDLVDTLIADGLTPDEAATLADTTPAADVASTTGSTT